MKLSTVCELMKLYTDCPICGNHFIGGKHGSLDIEDETFERSCKCGWKLKIKQTEDGYHVILNSVQNT